MQGNDKARTDHSFTSFHQQAAFAFLITPEVLGKLTAGGKVGGRREMGVERPGDSSSLCRPSFFAQLLKKRRHHMEGSPFVLARYIVVE